MPRGPRLDAPGVLHHVMGRGIERRKIFIEEEDYQDFIERLGAVLGGNAAVCYAWVLIPNHFHLLIRTSKGNLVEVMRKLMTGYAVNFNMRHKRVGHVFQNRYKSVICQEEPYLLELVRYIHLNPVRARLVPDVAGLLKYPWSGYRVLMGKVSYPWQDVEEVLGRFGKTLGEARRRFRSFMEEGVVQGKRPDLIGGGLIRSLGGWEVVKRMRRRRERILSDTRILGDGDFVGRVLREAEADQDTMEVTELISRVAVELGVEVEEVRGAGKSEAVADARALISYFAAERYKIRGVEVARVMGVSQAAVSKMISRGKRVIRDHPGLENKIVG